MRAYINQQDLHRRPNGKRALMNQLIEVTRSWWIDAQYSSSPLMQDRIIPALYRGRDLARQLLKPYLTVYRWRGHNPGGPLTVNYAGFGYASPFLKAVLFMEEPETTVVARVPIWRPAKFANLEGDITIVEASRPFVRGLPNQGAVVLPFHISLRLNIHGTWEDIERRFHPHARHYQRVLAKKFSYKSHLSHDNQDLESFYCRMYLPTLLDRYSSALASPTPFEEVRRHFRQGWLVWVRREDVLVAGCLCSVHQGVVSTLLAGVLDGKRELVKEGAQEAAVLAAIRCANEKGYDWLDFGGCWPFLEGVFNYKRKWGTVASISPEHKNKRIWTKIQRDSPAVSHFLQENPCVVVNSEDELHVLIVTDPHSPTTSRSSAQREKQYSTPGMKGLLVRKIEDLM